MPWPRRWTLYFILPAALALRLYQLFDPAWDYHNWRQTITLMVARDFARHGFHLLHPQVAWVSRDQPAAPSYFSGEFSIQSILAAVLYRIFGEGDALARLVVIAFSLAGVYFLYRLLERRAGPLPAALGAVVYSLLPYHLFFGRVFMPEVAAVSLALGALERLDRWTGERTWRSLLAAAALAALAILQKLTVAFLFLPALYLFWLAYGRKLPRRWEPYAFGLMAGLPSLAWYSHSAALAHRSGFAIMQPGRFGRELGLWLEGPFLRDIGKALAAEAFSPLGLALVAVGFLGPFRGRAAWTFRFWILGAAAVLISTPNLLPANHYYLCLLLPGGAALAGLLLAEGARRSRWVTVLLLILFAAGAIRSALPLYEADRLPWELGSVLQRVTAPSDLIVTETGGSPNVLYYADRRGWMLAGVYDPAVLERLRAAGARYYADVFPADGREHADFFRALDARFRHLAAAGLPCAVYDLTGPRSP